MDIISIIGVFCVACGIGFSINRKKQQRGETTWEGNHGIEIKKWWSPALVIFGVILIMASSFASNYSEYEGSNTYTESSADREISNKDSDVQKIVNKNNNQNINKTLKER